MCISSIKVDAKWHAALTTNNHERLYDECIAPKASPKIPQYMGMCQQLLHVGLNSHHQNTICLLTCFFWKCCKLSSNVFGPQCVNRGKNSYWCKQHKTIIPNFDWDDFFFNSSDISFFSFFMSRVQASLVKSFPRGHMMQWWRHYYLAMSFSYN